ncbi:hypothetical protein HMPREF1141_0639 [Clostridium sp. MSTE9]|nr:hypothetical protein HMPREF1141_0639 [Clostridium sp. MSTE9]
MGDFMEQIGRKKWYQLITFVILWLLATALIYFISNPHGVFFSNSWGLVINIILFVLVLVYMYYLRRKYGPNGALWKDKKFLCLFSIMIILAAGMAISTRLF